MRRALPLWLAAVVPATLAGHGFAYALTGRSAADGHHAWMAPVLEVSIALFIASCTALAADALLRTGIFTRTAAERSWLALWPRLSAAQLVLFIAIEHSEGVNAGVLGCAMQLLVALLTAYVLYAFARLVERCARVSTAASRYLQRTFQTVSSFISRRPVAVSYALAVHAGRSRFQRPPPTA